MSEPILLRWENTTLLACMFHTPYGGQIPQAFKTQTMGHHGTAASEARRCNLDVRSTAKRRDMWATRNFVARLPTLARTQGDGFVGVEWGAETDLGHGE
jgi:hypothetical protein